METARRVFVVGHNKTGTRSIHMFFQANGHAGVHWDNRRLAEAMASNHDRGRPLLEGYERYTVFSDMESVAWGSYGAFSERFVPPPGRLIHAYRWFALLDAQYPGSLFVYNVRPVEDWIESRLAHAQGRYAEAYRAILAWRSGEERFSLEDLKAHWRGECHEHERLLHEHFAGSPRFLEVDIMSPDAGERLAAFCERHGLAVRSRTLPHVGVRVPAPAPEQAGP